MHTYHKVQKLLATREDAFPNYRQECFGSEFSVFSEIRRSDKITDSQRTLYLMTKR